MKSSEMKLLVRFNVIKKIISNTKIEIILIELIMNLDFNYILTAERLKKRFVSFILFQIFSSFMLFI